MTKLHSYRKILMPMKRFRSPKYRELLEVLAEEQDQEFQRALEESAAQIKRRKVYLVRFLTQPGQAQLTQLGYPRHVQAPMIKHTCKTFAILTRSAFTSSGLRTG